MVTWRLPDADPLIASDLHQKLPVSTRLRHAAYLITTLDPRPSDESLRGGPHLPAAGGCARGRRDGVFVGEKGMKKVSVAFLSVVILVGIGLGVVIYYAPAYFD
jgi:hypothetical protein